MRVVFGAGEANIRIAYRTVTPGVLQDDDLFRLRAFPVEHRRTEAFGFSFEEKPRRPFLPERAEALGVPAGPIRRDLVNGRAVTLADGRTIQPDEVLGEETQGLRLVFIGDAGRVDNLVAEAAGADLLAIEATYTEEEREVAAAFGHLTAAQAAWLAREAGVGAPGAPPHLAALQQQADPGRSRGDLPRDIGRQGLRSVQAGEGQGAGARGCARAG